MNHEVIRIFTIIVAFICVGSFLTIIGFKAKRSDEDVTIFVHIFLTSFGYLVGILTGLLGLPK